MGSSSSKFKKYLQHGDEFAAMQVFQGSPELRKNLDPNLSYGEHHSHNTALHYAAKHGMKHLLRTFLIDLGGNPNKKNGLNETVLHAACQLDEQKYSYSAIERRATCVTLLLQWKGVALNTGGRERVEINAQDHDGNTALHWAAATGLKRCVELIVSQQGAALFIENNEKLTPCDLAMKHNHHDIARMLEARMVFADNSDTVNEDDNGYDKNEQEVYSGLRTQDLQEAKDQLLVETSDMLHIPLFTAEALLRDNEWSREVLLEKWMKDPVECCLLAGVQAPASALQTGSSIELTLNSPQSSFEIRPTSLSDGASLDSIEGSDILCEICLTNLPIWDQQVVMSCKHNFCSKCWECYLNLKIEEGDAHHILCPAYECNILVPVELIEKLVSPDMAKRYLQFDIKAFVESNKSIKWCPMAGCGRAVRLPEIEQAQPTVNYTNPNNFGDFKPPPATSHAVDCGNSHFFCWECLGEAHAPCGCIQWQQWQQKISEIKPEELRANCDESESAANCLWLVTNSKPCPNCKSPIQKNEGCNHMKCSKCKFDFCWVCQESWKRHSSATGGYFRCNRFEAVNKADEKQGHLVTAAVVRNSQLEELTRFLHYYTRFRNHENSQKLEEPLLTGVRQKMEILANALKGTEEKDMKFVEDGVRELLKARRVLCGSYVYGYYLEDNGFNKTIFEFMQNELEEVTEKISEIIARPYLRTPKAVIMQTTALARRKRHEFVRAVSKGLIPPETPPSLRKPEMHRLLEGSLKQLGPNNPWIKEAQERQHGSMDPRDWPDYDSDEDTGISQTLAIGLLGECKRRGCKKPRVRNPRTGVVNLYCSLRCCKFEATEIYRVPLSTDYNMDLVIALEMSRLEMIKDRMKLASQDIVDVIENLGDNRPSTSESILTRKGDSSLDEQLKLAIQLSLQENNSQIKAESVSTSTQAPELFSSNSSSSSVGITQNLSQKLLLEHRRSIKLIDKNLLAKHHPDLSAKQDEIFCKICKVSVDNCIQKNSESNNKQQYEDAESMYHYDKINADLTVDYFLKSLAPQASQITSTAFGNQNEYDPGYIKNNVNDKELLLPCFFKTIPAVRSRNEDGRFQIGDIHESGYIELVKKDKMGIGGEMMDLNNDVFSDDDLQTTLKRSHSTGDLIVRKAHRHRNYYNRIHCLGATVIPNNQDYYSSGSKYYYHFDSDHSSHHDEKCEEVAKKILKLPSSAAIYNTKQFLLIQHQQNDSNDSNPQSTSRSVFTPSSGGITSESSLEEPQPKIFYKTDHQSSLESTTTSESLMELPEPLLIKKTIHRQNSFDEEDKTCSEDGVVRKNLDSTFQLHHYKKSPKFLRASIKREESKVIIKTEEPSEEVAPSTSKMNPLACLKAKLCSAHFHTKTNYFSKSSSESSKESTLDSYRKLSHNLRIKICKSPGKSHKKAVQPKSIDLDTKKPNILETDSSNEYESETGIPKSPTLFISGVSISRTPESKSNGKQSRSSSLTVPTVISLAGGVTSTSNSSLNNILPPPGSPEYIYTPSLAMSRTPQTSYTNLLSASNTQKNSPVTLSPSKLNSMNKENFNPTSSTSIRMNDIGTKSFNFSDSTTNTPRVRSNSSGVMPKDLSNIIISPGLKSKSANEPEREREVFRFPKSSTDGALSSVLHIQESNLSSDDFHEALFLLESSSSTSNGNGNNSNAGSSLVTRSPKTPRDSTSSASSSTKRRKRSKKKEKDTTNIINNTEEASSAL